jgi:hypothetical protein
VLDEKLRNAWHARERAVPLSSAPHLAPNGLVFGVGTVVVAAEGARRLRSVRGQEARVLALLSAAYRRPVNPAVLGNIERAGKSWSEGDDLLAHIHLAHGGLRALSDPREAAFRLFITESLMNVGVSPRSIFEALEVGAPYIDAVEKLYNEDEPRVPSGSGRTSGEWTRELSFLAGLPASAAEELGGFAQGLLASRLGGAAGVAFGLLFIPSPNKLSVEGEVSGVAGLRYDWNRDERLLHFTYDGPDGSGRSFTAELQDDVFRDKGGRVVGRALPGGSVVIDPAAISADLVDEDEPKLCPMPGPDKFGGKERAKDYEDYVKSIVNPENPTPRGWGFQLPNPAASGALVFFDDCQHSTGKMVEAKGPGYAKLLTFAQESLTEDFTDQAMRQIAAAGDRPITWYFAEPEAAAFARELFSERKFGGRINVVFLPWPEKDR